MAEIDLSKDPMETMTDVEIFKTEAIELQFHAIPEENISFSRRKVETSLKEFLVYKLEAYIQGLPDHKIKIDEEFPEDWWEAFKDRWFPEWLLKRYPVKYKRIYVNQKIYKSVCPHMITDGTREHYEFFYESLKGLL